jgi:hypothetical protein
MPGVYGDIVGHDRLARQPALFGEPTSCLEFDTLATAYPSKLT